MEERLRRCLGPFDCLMTDGPGAAIDLAHAAARGGAERVVAVGGDGTINEVLNGLLAAEARHGVSPAMGILHCGTGGDLRRSLGIPANLDQAAQVIADHRTRRLDVGQVTFHVGPDQTASRYFAILASFGIAAAICKHAARAPAGLNGKLAFLWATLRALPSYRDQGVVMRWTDSTPAIETKTLKAFVLTNGPYCGGGMHLAPTASLDDGLMNAVSIEHLSLMRSFWELPRIYSGRLFELPQVTQRVTRQLTAEPAVAGERVELEIDGEVVGTLPATFRVCPRAIAVIAPADVGLG
jgi:YegS/Rv2252/BmrU family lipid kinase